MSDDKDLTSAGVPWNDVPEFARRYVAWMDGTARFGTDTATNLDVSRCRTFSMHWHI